MAESKGKKALTGILRIPPETDREIDMEASRLGLFKYEVALRAWEAYKAAKAAASGATPTTVPDFGKSTSSDLRSGADSATKVSSRLLNSLEQSGRTDLLNIATAMLRVLLTEAESGGKGGEHSPGRQAGPGGQGVDLDRARRGVEAAQEHAERIIEEFGGSGRSAEKPGVPGRPRKRTGGAA